MVLNLWVATLLVGVTYQISRTPDIYITTQNSNKIAVMKYRGKNLEFRCLEWWAPEAGGCSR